MAKLWTDVKICLPLDLIWSLRFVNVLDDHKSNLDWVSSWKQRWSFKLNFEIRNSSDPWNNNICPHASAIKVKLKGNAKEKCGLRSQLQCVTVRSTVKDVAASLAIKFKILKIDGTGCSGSPVAINSAEKIARLLCCSFRYLLEVDEVWGEERVDGRTTK